MANRRMFSKDVVESSRFLKMPMTAQCLYFHLGINADDDGVVEAYNVMNMTRANIDDLNVLQGRDFVKVLNQDYVTYIVHWPMQNQIRASRRRPSPYRQLLLSIFPDLELLPCKTESAVTVLDTNILPERNLLNNCQSDDSQMTAECQPGDSQMTAGCQSNDSQMTDNCQPDVVQMTAKCQPGDSQTAAGCQPNVAQMTANCQPGVSQTAAKCQPSDSQVTGECQSSDSQMTSRRQPIGGRVSADCQPNSSKLPAQYSVVQSNTGQLNIGKCSAAERGANDTLTMSDYNRLVGDFPKRIVDKTIQRIKDRAYKNCMNYETIAKWCAEECERNKSGKGSNRNFFYSNQREYDPKELEMLLLTCGESK